MKQGTESRQWTYDEALALVCDQTQPLSRAIITFLSGAGRAQVSRLAGCWPQMPVERQRELISTMVDMAEADFEMDFIGIFRWALQSADPVVRERAVEGLWEDEQPSLIDPLLRMMRDDPDVNVRARSTMLLGRFALLAELGDVPQDRADRLREGLLEAIEKPGEAVEVRRRAIESIAYLSDAPVRGIIERAYASSDERLQISAVFAMGRTADPHWADIVRDRLRAPDPAMRYEAARAAGEIGLRTGVKEVIDLLDDPDSEVRQMAIWALGQIGGAQARRALEECRSSRDEAVREAAEEALDELEFATAPLDQLFREGERKVGRAGVAGEGEPGEG